MQPEYSKDFNVAILGGGMGGLALAVGLIRGGVKVDVFEQAVIGSPDEAVRSIMLIITTSLNLTKSAPG